MAKHRLLCAAVLVLCLAGGAQAAHDHGHANETGTPQKLQLDGGKKWLTDAPLQQAMSEINQAMAKALPLIHKHRFGDAQYQALADTVNQNVAFAVENCKLDTRADAMLHLVLSDLMGGAEKMSGKVAGNRHDGAVQVLHALKAYGEYFQHPGWRVAKG